MITGITAEERHHYFEHGYLIKRNVFSPGELERIRAGVRRIIDRAGSGEGKDVPWINREKGVPARVSDLLHPGYAQPELLDALESSPIVDIVEAILEAPVRYSMYGMLANGDGREYSLRWHRDACPTEGGGQVYELLKIIRYCCQFNAPLFRDTCLRIVPGSHIRPVTDEERHALKHHPHGPMPGEMIVELEAGDIAFYYANLLHTGQSRTGELRWTLHAAFWREDKPLWEGELRQVDWVASCDKSGYGPRVRAMLERFEQASARK